MMRRFVKTAVFAAVVLGLGVAAPVARADEADLPNLKWSFSGPFGTYDRASAQRGYQIYKEVCSTCHSMKLMTFRALAGIGLEPEQIRAIAASVDVPTTDDDGKPVTRKGLPSDHFPSPFPNEKAAKSANGGAVPPDQSDIAKARGLGSDGANYIYGIVMGYKDAPPDMKIADGKYYNTMMSGHVIGMPQPLQDGSVTYADGTKATLEQEARDIATFLTFVSNPDMEARKRLGVRVVLFLALMTGLTYAVKRKVWADVH